MSGQQSRFPQSDKDDKKANSSKSDPVIAKAAGVPIGTDAHFEAIWNESEKVPRKSQQDRAQWIKKLKRELSSNGKDGLSRYFLWVRESRLNPPSQTPSPFELSVDLHKVNWFEGNKYLLHLNSLLSLSITAPKESIHDLMRWYMDRRLGMVVHGRPLSVLPADAEKCTSMGRATNSELLLAVRYLNVDCPAETATKKTAMLFAPLGHILIEVKFDRKKWAYTGLVLVAEIQQDGTVGSLYYILPPKDDDGVEGRADAFNRREELEAGQREKLKGFQQRLTFTLAKLDDGLALVENPADVRKTVIGATVLSRKPVEILHTGSLTNGQPSMPIPLEPKMMKVDVE